MLIFLRRVWLIIILLFTGIRLIASANTANFIFTASGGKRKKNTLADTQASSRNVLVCYVRQSFTRDEDDTNMS